MAHRLSCGDLFQILGKINERTRVTVCVEQTAPLALECLPIQAYVSETGRIVSRATPRGLREQRRHAANLSGF